MSVRRRSIKHLVDDLTKTFAFKTGLSIGDRLVYSGINFLTMVAVGRLCGLEDLGVFALAWTVLLTVNVVQEAFILSPFTVAFGRFKDDGQRRRYAGTALIFQMSLAVAIMVLVAVAVTVFSS